jgi:cell division inhibitor SepF
MGVFINMGVLDKFLDIMRLSDDDDYEDDDFFDDDYEDDYEEKPKKGLFRRGKKDSYDDDYDDEDYDYEPPAKSRSSRSNNKVTPMRQPSRRSNGVSMEVCVIRPNSVEDAREITETLLNGRTVILNLEGMDLEIAQRIIDFTSGAAYAISGNLQKISNYIFLVTPTNVDISGDLQDLLNTSFDASSMRSRF